MKHSDYGRSVHAQPRCRASMSGKLLIVMGVPCDLDRG
eukprot:CAMPEP_0198127330 /NCGR_PEP_ID=MMETSP1442-20131203/46902_1 /TAXON_ID= /ORGANISM="Craspedostauros australis, Strain CCMP3328" /LENGTH=37 /DNA_ID= /DNA_START= /DNA_END= /DNA_ORIENTATION=